MGKPLVNFLARCQQRCQTSLSVLLGDPSSEYVSDACGLLELFAAAQYSLSSGGKYIRATMVYAAAGLQSGKDPVNSRGLDHIACAVEMIHTYSLIHDDLPAMDDDDLRRGKPSCHKAFDEATAILAGDALQSRAFELLAEAPGFNAEQKIAMVKILASAAGPRGMVGGQAIDMAAVNGDIDLPQLQAMHALKTGALIRASLALGACAAGGNSEQMAALDEYGRDIGLAFQIVDDILDVEGDSFTLGKTQGKDGAANKPTYVKLMGLVAAKEEAQRLHTSALSALEIFCDSAENLRELARLIVDRDH